MLHQRGIQLSHETIHEWCIKCTPLFVADLCPRKTCRGSRWHLDEVRTSVVDEHGFVLDIHLQRRCDTEAAKTFLTRLLGEYDVPEVIHTNPLRS